MYLPIEFEDIGHEENEKEFNANHFEDEMSERESDSDVIVNISSCAGSE
jgi:hypothetical protein